MHDFGEEVCNLCLPPTLPVETCDGARWDTVLQLRNATSSSLGCDDDSCGVQSSLTRSVGAPGPYWAIIDGCDERGTYTMADRLP